LVIEVVCEDCSEDMGEGIDGAPVSGVVDVEDGHEDVVDRFDDTSSGEHEFIVPVHRFVFHVFADSGDEVNALLVIVLEVCADVSFVTEALSLDVAQEFVQHPFGVVGDVCGGDDEIHDFA